jgi:glycosyltransferase involved in cell wall biosynthesis
MACGCAVVTTHVGGLPEVINYGKDSCGVLVPPDSPECLSSAIVGLCFSRERRRELGERGRFRVISSFSAETNWKRYEALYQRFLL